MRHDADTDKANGPRWWDRFHAIFESELSSKHKLAMLAIAGFAGDSNECTASMRTLASRLSVSEDTARRTIGELHDTGHIERGRRQHSSSVLSIQWHKFGLSPQPAKSPIGDSADRRFRRSQPEELPVDTSYINTKLNTQNSRGGGTRFVPPTVEEVAAYCRERGNAIDPEKFVDYYTATDWMRGKSKMKDWKAAVRIWEHNEGSFSQRKPKSQSGLFAWASNQEDLDHDEA